MCVWLATCGHVQVTGFDEKVFKEQAQVCHSSALGRFVYRVAYVWTLQASFYKMFEAHNHANMSELKRLTSGQFFTVRAPSPDAMVVPCVRLIVSNNIWAVLAYRLCAVAWSRAPPTPGCRLCRSSPF